MKKILHKIFPLLDHLYIFQILEYDGWAFLRWFLSNPLKRNLQIKHKLKFTQKSFLLLFLSLALLIIDSVWVSLELFRSILPTPIILLLLAQLSPFYILIAQLLIIPIEIYSKNKTLQKARSKLNKLPNLSVIAITGSYGKTSTKDILYTLLWKKFKVVKTPKSYNTPLGVAQTILEDVKSNTDILIAEVGAYKKREIEKIAKLIKPKIGIITALAPQHLERFGSLENIAKAKFELAENLSQNGIAILNGEYEILHNLALHLRGIRTNFYGTNKDSYFVTDIKTGIEGTEFILHTPKGKAEIKIPLIGEHHAYNFLAASIAALNLGLSLKEIKERAKLLLPTPHRMEIKRLGNIILIDNSYNTNPESAKASLDLLQSFNKNRKIVITPGFVELGKEAAQANREFGKEIACLADEVIIVGENAKKDLLEGLKVIYQNPIDDIHLVNSTQEGIQLTQQLIKEYVQQVARNDVEVVVLLENDLPDQYS